jgi:hypothetical protein
MIRLHTLMGPVAVVFALIAACPLFAEETHVLKARVADIDGRPMAGAKLFLYDSSSVRRPADFISSLSDLAGQLQVVMPPGKYWVVARFKADGKYGPLMPGDKHSGEPLEVDMTGNVAEAEFIVADIRELGQKKRAGATEALRLKGCVVDAQGAPVAQAYVFANRSKEFNELPDFISAWTGDDGRFEIYVPSGAAYYIGVSRQLPLMSRGGNDKLTLIESGKIDIATDINLTVQ